MNRGRLHEENLEQQAAAALLPKPHGGPPDAPTGLGLPATLYHVPSTQLHHWRRRDVPCRPAGLSTDGSRTQGSTHTVRFSRRLRRQLTDLQIDDAPSRLAVS